MELLPEEDSLSWRGTSKLLQMLAYDAEAEKMSDKDLRNAVVEQIWAKQGLGERQSSLLLELLGRFEKLAGIKEIDSAE